MKITELYSKEWAFLTQMVENGKLPHALLISGQKGIGKYLFIQQFVQYLFCESNKKPCGKCQGCSWFLKNQHPDFRSVLPAALQPDADSSKKTPSPYIVVEQLRALSDFLYLSTHQQGLRIVLIYPAEAMNTNAANAILKSLEEPIPNTLFLLITNQKERLLPTIKSRCQEVHFQTPNFENALNYLLPNFDKEKAITALSYFSGAPILAETELKNGFLNKEWLKELTKILNNGAKIDPVGAAKVFDKMLRDKTIDLQRLTDAIQKWLVDLILLKFTNKNRFFIQMTDAQQHLNAYLNHDKMLRFYPQFLAKKQQLSQPLNPKLFLEGLFLQYRALFL